MLRSEVISWPVTLAIMLLAFGSLVAAGLPLMLTMLGLVAAAGLALPRHADPAGLDLGDELRADVRARARHRLRALRRPPLPRRLLRLAALGPRRRPRRRWTPPARRSCFSGLTVLISLSAVMLVPSPAFRSMSLGIMLAVIFVLAATLTLLPGGARQARPRGSTSFRCPGSTPASTARRASPPGASGSGGIRSATAYPRSRSCSCCSRCRCSSSRPPCPRSRSCPRATPRASATQQVAGGASARVRPGRCSSSRRPADTHGGRRRSRADPGIAQVMPAERSRQPRADSGDPDARTPPTRRRARRSTGCGPTCRRRRWSAEPSPRTTISRRRCPRRRRW